MKNSKLGWCDLSLSVYNKIFGNRYTVLNGCGDNSKKFPDSRFIKASPNPIIYPFFLLHLFAISFITSPPNVVELNPKTKEVKETKVENIQYRCHQTSQPIMGDEFFISTRPDKIQLVLIENLPG